MQKIFIILLIICANCLQMMSSTKEYKIRKIFNNSRNIKELTKVYLEDSCLFCTIYPEACKSYYNTLYDNKDLFNKIITIDYNLDKNSVLSIVAPEISFYNLFIGKMEIIASEIFYVQLGFDYADFSVGIFQMKPSFIEEMERSLDSFPELEKYKNQIEITNPDITKKRSIRLDRLKQVEWQLKYLCIYYIYMEKKHQNKKFISTLDKIKFYATAYNCGFNKSDSVIEEFYNLKFFPSGKLGYKHHFQYGNISTYFYKKNCKLANH